MKYEFHVSSLNVHSAGQLSTTVDLRWNDRFVGKISNDKGQDWFLFSFLNTCLRGDGSSQKNEVH